MRYCCWLFIHSIELRLLDDYTASLGLDTTIVINEVHLLAPLEMLEVFSIIEFNLQWDGKRQTILKSQYNWNVGALFVLVGWKGGWPFELVRRRAILFGQVYQVNYCVLSRDRPGAKI